jgi:hypothetical protein
MAACLRADAVYSFGVSSLTMNVDETVSVPLYLTLTVEHLDLAKDKDPAFREIMVTISYDLDLYPDLVAGLVGTAPNSALGFTDPVNLAFEETTVFYPEHLNQYGFGSSAALSGTLPRVLIATMTFEAFEPGKVVFTTENGGDVAPRVFFADGTDVDNCTVIHPGNASLAITVLPTAVPLPAACWGGLALLGITVAVRVRSALRR